MKSLPSAVTPIALVVLGLASGAVAAFGAPIVALPLFAVLVFPAVRFTSVSRAIAIASTAAGALALGIVYLAVLWSSPDSATVRAIHADVTSSYGEWSTLVDVDREVRSWIAITAAGVAAAAFVLGLAPALVASRGRSRSLEDALADVPLDELEKRL